MSLLDLSWRNVRRNFRMYTIYLFSMIIGVIIFFTFSSLMLNEDVLAALENKENFQLGVMVASAVVFIFIIFFILYANSFFMKQRKKEFGMYLLYGMSERQIAVMVFIETSILSSISLVSGILVGGLLSKFFGMLLMSLMQYDNTISFSFPIEAIGSTILLFVLLIGIICIQSYLNVSRFQLVELFNSKSKLEKPQSFSKLLALSSILLLAMAYFLITRSSASTLWKEHSNISIILITVGIIGGTYLFFRQFSGWFLETISRGKKYNEGNKVLWSSSLRFSIRGNTLNLTFISLFSALIIILVGFVSINYTVQFDLVERVLPNHIAYESLDEQTQEEIKTIIQESDHPMIHHETLTGLSASTVSDMSIAFENPEYFTEEVLLVSETRFNDIVTLRGHDQLVDLQGQEAIALSEGIDYPERIETDKQPEFVVHTNVETVFQLVERKDYSLLGWSSDPRPTLTIKPSVLVISDDAFQSLKNDTIMNSYEIYVIEDAANAKDLSEQLHAIVSKIPGSYYSSFADLYSVQIESSSLMLFAAAFLAVIAIFALGSIIFFKQLREATEEQKQYAILRKIGVGNHEMKSVIRKQLLFVFLPPLILGILHSWIIIKYTMLDAFKDFPQLTSIIWTILIIYFVIYFLFYVSSSNIYYKIANQKS